MAATQMVTADLEADQKLESFAGVASPNPSIIRLKECVRSRPPARRSSEPARLPACPTLWPPSCGTWT